MIVGHIAHLDAGAGENVHVIRRAAKDEPAASVLFLRGERPLQIDDRNVVVFKDGLHVLQKIFVTVFVHELLEELFVRAALLRIAAERAVAHGGNHQPLRLALIAFLRRPARQKDPKRQKNQRRKSLHYKYPPFRRITISIPYASGTVNVWVIHKKLI